MIVVEPDEEGCEMTTMTLQMQSLASLPHSLMPGGEGETLFALCNSADAEIQRIPSKHNPSDGELGAIANSLSCG